MAIDVGQSVEIHRPAADVFDSLAHGENMPRWMSVFETVEQDSEGAPAKGTTYRYKMAARGKAESTFEWTQFEPGRKLAWEDRRSRLARARSSRAASTSSKSA